MHKKVMLEFPGGNRRWGYATTEKTEPSNALRITTKHGSLIDGYTRIITSDAELAVLLKSHGYQVDGMQAVRTGVTLPATLYDKIQSDAIVHNRTVNSFIVDILKDYYIRNSEK